LPAWGTQWPATQVALAEGGCSQCAATHFHWPPMEFHWPPIQTEPCAGAAAAPVVSIVSAKADWAKAVPAIIAALASKIRVLVFMVF
jgi:hypothetical protein